MSLIGAYEFTGVTYRTQAKGYLQGSWSWVTTHKSYFPDAPCTTCRSIPAAAIWYCFFNLGERSCESGNFMNYYISSLAFCVLDTSLLLPGGNVLAERKQLHDRLPESCFRFSGQMLFVRTFSLLGYHINH